jgi:hypothetical protein
MVSGDPDSLRQLQVRILIGAQVRGVGIDWCENVLIKANVYVSIKGSGGRSVPNICLGIVLERREYPTPPRAYKYERKN